MSLGCGGGSHSGCKVKPVLWIPGDPTGRQHWMGAALSAVDGPHSPFKAQERPPAAAQAFYPGALRPHGFSSLQLCSSEVSGPEVLAGSPAAPPSSGSSSSGPWTLILLQP